MKFAIIIYSSLQESTGIQIPWNFSTSTLLYIHKRQSTLLEFYVTYHH